MKYAVLSSDTMPSRSSWLLDEDTVKSRSVRFLLNIMRKLDGSVPILVLYPRRKPEAVKAIESQLKSRPDFPVWSWTHTTLDRGTLENTLKAIATELRWPNHHFLPNDPAYLVFMAAGWDDLFFLCNRARQHSGKELARELRELIATSDMEEVVSLLNR